LRARRQIRQLVFHFEQFDLDPGERLLPSG
jgi:hypothetical protein